MSDDDTLHALHQALNVLADEVGFREANIKGHQQNASQIARTIAQIMRVDEDTIEGIRIAATLHDCGFLRIPQGILSKPGTLTEEEFKIVRQHSQHGHDILAGIDFPWPVATMVLQHHERLDGSGYPQGLRGNEILMESQIVAVADVMESMTSDRPWRKAMEVDAALDELLRASAIKFDASVVEACMDLYTKQRYRLDPEYYGRG